MKVADVNALTQRQELKTVLSMYNDLVRIEHILTLLRGGLFDRDPSKSPSVIRSRGTWRIRF